MKKILQKLSYFKKKKVTLLTITIVYALEVNHISTTGVDFTVGGARRVWLVKSPLPIALEIINQLT